MKKKLLLIIAILFTNFKTTVWAQTVTTLYNGTCNVSGVTIDPNGNVFFTERGTCKQLRKLDSLGNITPFNVNFGNNDPFFAHYHDGYIYVSYHWSPEKKIVRVPINGGTPQDYVTGILSTYGPADFTFDGDTLYFVEYAEQRIYKVLPGGGAVGGYNVIPIQNTSYGIAGSGPRTLGITIGHNGNLFVSTFSNNNIYEVNKVTGTVSVYFTDAQLYDAHDIEYRNGLYYITGMSANKIFTYDPLTNTLSAIAGSGTAGCTDGPAANANLYWPTAIELDSLGNIFFGLYNCKAVSRLNDCGISISTPSTGNACPNESYSLESNVSTYNYGYTVTWSGPNGFNSSTEDTVVLLSSVNNNGYYVATVTDIYGCTAKDSVYVNASFNNTSTISASSCGSYNSPSGNYTWSVSGVYVDTISSVAGCDSIITINLTINNVSDINTSISGATITANNSNASYQWLDCNNSFAVIPGATSQSYTPSVSGSYAVQLTENTCVDTSACVNVTITGIKNIGTSEKISLYPNPAKDAIRIANAPVGAMLNITDITGKTVYSSIITNAQMQVNTSNLVSGVYMVQVLNEGQVSIQKLVINKN